MAGIGTGFQTSFLGFESYSGGHRYFALTAAMSTNPQVVVARAGRVCRLINPSASAQTATVTVYDSDNTTTSGKQALWAGVLGASAVVDVQVPASLGITVVASAAVTGSILVTFV